MKKIITITGDLGSGKSTVSNLLKEKLNYDYIYTGKIQREIADRYKMTTLELNKYAETHPQIDAEIDATFKSLKRSTDLIVDSRMAWFFLPQSFKVYLKTNLLVSANRISGDKQRRNETYASNEEASRNIIERKTSENKRYKALYGADSSDPFSFNLTIDTSFVTPERVAGIINAQYEAWLARGECFKAFISPLNLYPTRPAHLLDKDTCQALRNDMATNGYNPEHPILIVRNNSFDYILDGHKRTAAAIHNRIDLIPAIYADDTLPSADPALLGEWEEFNTFKYAIYPIQL
ncbi:MAG: cytidylate kinase family protein [Tannerellaceae bacterium]|jgi:cytidylate kinase|nr:cytidylate kinase family protein [Tannerellaceae bacterium]